MENNQNAKIKTYISVVGFALGVLFGMAGSAVKDPVTQVVFYEISSIGLTVAAVLMAWKFAKENADLLSAGFLILAIGEAVMSGGAATDSISSGAQSSFGAGMALYVPALLMISLPKGYPLFVRITGSLASIPFAIAAAMIFMGQEVLSTSPFPSAGYGLLSLTIIGWIYTLLREIHN